MNLPEVEPSGRKEKKHMGMGLDDREVGWTGVKTKAHLYVVTEREQEVNPPQFTFPWMAGTAFDTWLKKLNLLLVNYFRI